MVTTPTAPEIKISVEELERELRRLAGVYGRAINADGIAAWYQAIGFMPLRVLQHAVDRCIFERDRFPAPATIVGYAERLATEVGALPPDADDAWLVLLETAKAASGLPGVGIHDFELHPAIVDSATDAGASLAKLSAMNEYERSQARKDFTRIYGRRRGALVHTAITSVDIERLPQINRIALPAPGAKRAART